MGVVMWYGSLDLQDIVRAQGGLLFGWIPKWGSSPSRSPSSCSSRRHRGHQAIPFDMPEGESEIIGYFVEYSGMKFGMFAMADFLETVVVAGLTTSLFLGGWQVPYLYDTGVRFPWGTTVALPNVVVARSRSARSPSRSS